MLVLAIAVAIAGCGGSDPAASGDTTARSESQGYQVRASTEMTTATPPLTKARFIALTNKICREGWKEVQGNFRDYMSWREAPQTKRERFVETVRVSLMAGIDFHIFDQIQNQGTAPGEEQRIEELLGAMQKPLELNQQNHWKAHTLAEVPPHFGDYNRLAKQYGLNDCPVNMANLRPIEASGN